jgi:putative drug exporter of the RND superfamily
VPAFLTLMGEKAWYIPRWLDRLLPDITIEPPHDRGVEPRVEPRPEPTEA